MMQDGEIKYGVNVRLLTEDGFTRYATVDKIDQATLVTAVLAMNHNKELRLWDKVEIEKITMINGEPQYEQVGLWDC